MLRKRRTRQHIIEDLGINHAERQVLLAGFTMERVRNDYGYDFSIQTYDPKTGEVETGYLLVQLKSTDSMVVDSWGEVIEMYISKKDLLLWLFDPTPVVLIVYDAKEDYACWVNIQEYFLQNGLSLEKIRKFIRIQIPRTQKWNPSSVMEMRILKENKKRK